MSIISQNSNDVYYAYTRGRFWRWDESARVWKESHLLAQKFDKAKTAEKHLTPEAFLTSDEFIPMDDYELPERMLTALRDAKPCKNAPIEPVEEESSSDVPASCICSTCTCGGCKEECFGNCRSCGHPVQECNSYQTEGEKHLTPTLSEDVAKPEVPGTQTTQDKPLTTVPDAMRPAFDYSGLTDQTVEDLHFAEDEYHHGKQMAERGLVHMGNAIAVAHDALCGVVAQCDNSKHGNRGDDTFRAWCVSIGITKDTAYRLLQVSALLDGSSPRQQKILKELSPTLLYAVAKPSAPAELVEQVKNGDITTNKQYQEAMAQIKAEKDRAAAAEAREEEAWNMVSKAQDEAQTAKNDLDAALADVQGLDEENARLKAEKEKAERSYNEMYESRIAANLQRQKAEAERDRAEERAKNAEDALKKQPITAVIDEEEIDRRAAEKAWGLADARNAELAKDNANLKKQVAALRSRINDDAQADFEQANYCASLMRAAWDNSKASYSRLVGEDLESTFQTICGTLNSIMEEASLLCRQPPDYDGGDRDE
jgi:DNA polymerase III delta prime subunit